MTTLPCEFAYPGGADADLIAGKTLVEIKTTIGSRPRLVSVLQTLGYLLMCDDHELTSVGWVFPRSGMIVTFGVDELLARTAGEPVELTDLREGFWRLLENANARRAD